MIKKFYILLLAIVASVGLSWATDPIVIVTNTEQSSYTQDNITITCSKPGDSEGFYLEKSGNETATITVSGSSTISQIELGIGWFPDFRSYVRANGAESTSSDAYAITFSNVNSNEVTLTITDEKIQIRDVTITLADEAAPATARPLAEATAEDLGKIVGADGNIYDTKDAAETAGTTAVAMIAYVGSDTDHATYKHGLAIALANEKFSNWSTAKSTCEGKSAVTNAAWLLPSENQWKAMFKAFGDNDASYTGLNTAITNAGGTALANDDYWTSSEVNENNVWFMNLRQDIAGWNITAKNLPFLVRACLAFGGDAAPANSCGGGLTWEFNTETGALTISYDGEGTGVMNDYDIPNDNLAPWYANRENITSVSLPEGIKTIGKDAFRDCVNLTTVTIPNSVTTIGESAFVSVEHLETVTIGTGITSIVNGAFYGNAELTTVTCSATTPPSIGEMVFGSCQNLEHIYVPAESVDTYKTAWSDYASLISAIGGGSTDVIPCTAADLGKVLCTDGSIYATVSEATAAGKTAVAMIAYVDTENGKGLALALADDGGEMLWGTAMTTVAAHTPDVSGGTWTLASKDDWDNMITAAGSYTALRDGFSAVGGTNMQEEAYWSSTDFDFYAWCYRFNNGSWFDDYQDGDNYVRACLAFDIPAAPAYEKVINLINEIPNPVVLTAECKAKIDAARAAYDALSDDDKAQVTNYETLTQAEATFNQAEADKVVAKIAAIPTPVELKLATRDSIQNARAAYDALTADQQALVSNYQTLLDAEAALAELNKGGSASVDIVWDGNTGIENVSPTTTSPAYEGMTVTVGQGSSFSTYQSRLYFTFNSQPNGGFIFANENGANITKVVIESTTALTSTMTEVDRMGSEWVISNENKTATWTGNTDSVSIWKGEHFANYWVTDKITFTVNASSTPLDSAQAVKDLIDAIPTPVEYPASGAAIEAALNAYNELSDAAKGALDDADVQKLNDAVAQYAALEAIAAIDNIPEITYDPAVKAAIETAREKYDALSDASKALVSADEVEKLTNAEQAWAALVAKVEHNVTYFGKESDELKVEKVALLRLPDPAPDLNGFEFVRWDVKAGDLLEEGLHIKAVYDPIITTNPVAYDTLVYNGTEQTLVTAGAAKEGHIEYSLNSKDNWSTELPTATIASTNVVYYKLVREGHEDYLADSIVSIIAKVPVAYTEPQAYDTLVYNAANQTLIIAGQTNDGTFEYSLNPTQLDSWKTELPKAMDAGTYNVYYRVMGDINHLDSIAAAPVAVTIAKAELTATADDKNVTYGDAVPVYTITYDGWLGEDTITVLNGDIAFACQYAPTSNVGEYTITPSGVSAANYNITFVNGKVTVAQALLTVTAENKTVTYGDAVPAYTATYSGWKNSDNASVVSGLVYTCEYTPTSNVGEYTITPSGATATNYTFAYVNGKLTVNQAALMITAEDKEVTYGDPVPTYTAAYSGWKNSDNASVVSGLVYACEYAPTSNVGEYTITPSGATAQNYAISYTNGKVTVGKADLMITADDKNVIYGDAVPTYTATYSGWKNNDDASVVSGLAYACEYAPTSNVGEYTITPSGATATNYAISFTNGKVTVAQATLIVTAENKEVTYGDEAPEFTVTYSGWKNSDDASVVSDLAYTTQYIPGSSVGTYTINPNSATAQNYAITFVDGELTVVKAVVSVSGAEAQIAKFEDGDTDAVVLNNGTLNGIKLNDDIDIETTAAFSDAATGENKTITLSYELTGNASLFKNYDLQPTSEIFTTDAVIIEQMNPDKSAATEEEAENKEGFEVYAYGYCDGNSYSIRYHLESGNPDQYKIAFDNSRFDDVDWTDLTVAGKEGTIDIDIPEDMPTGDYRMTITFRDSRFTWLESDPITVSFHVNLPKAYTAVLFDNVISLVNTCNCLTDIQWYHRDSSDDIWQAIDGANGYYYRQLGGLTGEYFVSVKMNEVATYTCPQTDMETLYGDGSKIVRVNVVPNPVVDNATVTIQGSDKLTHSLSIINLMGAEMEYRTFEGDATTVEMGEYISGNYMISVDGVAVKVIKK